MAEAKSDLIFEPEIVKEGEGYGDLKPEEVAELREAVLLLEQPGFIARLSDFVGSPIEMALSSLPAGAGNMISSAANMAIKGALEVAINTLNDDTTSQSADKKHMTHCGLTGALGGFFGLPGLVVELPVSTGIMLRAVADIARANGEDIGEAETKLACISVFALGGNNEKVDGVDTAYYAARYLLAGAVSEAASYVTKKGVVEIGAPALIRLVSLVASRFGVAVSEKIVAQALPVIGAIGGATVNVLFMDHFQSVAKGHFTVRKLERKYDEKIIQAAYNEEVKKLKSGK